MNNKKIGIVSLFNGQNFGNKLQNYAVQELLREYGLVPETFKYEIRLGAVNIRESLADKLRPSHIKSYISLKLKRFLPLKNTDTGFLTKVLWMLRNRQQANNAQNVRVRKYSDFDAKKLRFADRKIMLDKSDNSWAEEYCKFVCGSDQVWNPYYPSTTGVCFLQFAKEEQRIALAPSFGVSAIPEERKAEFRAWLNSIPQLSVREAQGARIIKELCGREAEVLVDPTMCLPVEAWRKFAVKPDFSLPKRYLLTYFLGDRSREYRRYIEKTAQAKQLEIVDLFDLMSPAYFTCSPDEFVYCIEHAEFICTDSFHACVFSLLFKKQFCVFDRIEGKRSMSSRIENFLKTFGLENCRYKAGASGIPALTSYDGSEIILEKERSKVRAYLSKALNTSGEI